MLRLDYTMNNNIQITVKQILFQANQRSPISSSPQNSEECILFIPFSFTIFNFLMSQQCPIWLLDFSVIVCKGGNGGKNTMAPGPRHDNPLRVVQITVVFIMVECLPYGHIQWCGTLKAYFSFLRHCDIGLNFQVPVSKKERKNTKENFTIYSGVDKIIFTCVGN